MTFSVPNSFSPSVLKYVIVNACSIAHTRCLRHRIRKYSLFDGCSILLKFPDCLIQGLLARTQAINAYVPYVFIKVIISGTPLQRKLGLVAKDDALLRDCKTSVISTDAALDRPARALPKCGPRSLVHSFRRWTLMHPALSSLIQPPGKCS